MMGKLSFEILYATEPLIAGVIRFRTPSTADLPGRVWEFVCSPDGDVVFCGDEEGLEELRPGGSGIPAGPIIFDYYLPDGWTYQEFMIAWRYWVKGYRTAGEEM